ncbi:MAG: nodulation protein NfeD [Hoeflea sp.]|uniref:LysR family transcriptional regulator n=1 Tax=Hoeflea sp. TaxID=1940281 RepID=UPI000C11D415|nr:LysR family transcriptional regulator [Hoeflea sp.]PHR25373.1 MAG: nodulation protein NfeD [Hoeflea sp.]
MRFKNLDLNLLVALDLLLMERNVSRAAAKMHITQSAMSNALARLRDYFRDDLLVQVGRRMDLTPRAELLREPVRDILVRIESSVTATPDFDPTVSDKTFRIFVSDYSLATLVPQFLQLVSPGRFPIRFEFRPQSSDPRKTLDAGDADLLIIPEEYASQAHPSEVIFTEDFVCIADIDHPRIGDELDLEAFARERHAVMQPPHDATSFETLGMRRHGIDRNIDATTFSFASLPYLVAGTERLATIHARLAKQACLHLPLKIMPLPFTLAPMRQAIQWHAYRSNDPALNWLKDRLRLAASQLA